MPMRTIRFYRVAMDFGGTKTIKWKPKAGMRLLQAAISHSDAGTSDTYGKPLVFDKVLPDGDRPCLSIARSRYKDLPLKHDESLKLEPLDFEESEAIAERTHVVFFPRDVVAIEHNQNGPWSGAIAAGMRAKVPEFEGLHFLPLIDMTGLSSALGKFTEITRIDAKLNLSQGTAEDLGDHGPVIDVYKNSAADLEPEHATFSLWINSSRGHLKGARKFLASISRGRRRAGFEKLTLRGPGAEDGRMRTEQVLSTQIVHKSEMMAVSERSKAVDSASAFSVIISTYKLLRKVIRKAAELE